MPSSSKPLPPDAEDLVFDCLESSDPRGTLDKLCEDRPEDSESYRRIFADLDRHGLLKNRESDTRAGTGTGRDHPEKLGPYRLFEKLGHGGMGVVFLGIDESLGRKVAVKLIRPEQLYVPGNKERFKREVNALLDLSHPGIVRVLGAGEDQGIPYYAMEFVEGLSLAEVIQDLHGQNPAQLQGTQLLAMLDDISAKEANRDGSASSNVTTRLTEELGQLSWPDLCLRLITEAAEALQHAHEQQVIHRDVKPSNLLLTQAGHLRLVDFGLAHIEDGQRLTKSTAELGSLPYLAPEFLSGPADRLDPRQDVYSLGVTLYELLTLHCPYLGKNQEDTRRRILEAHPQDPRKLNTKISWDLATVCLRAMDPEPAHRYQSCADLLQDLANLRARRPINATRPKPLLRLRRWAERRPRASAVLITGTLLLLLSGFLYGLSESKARRQIEALYEQARHLNYVGNIRTAKMDIDSNDAADGKFRLLSCPENLRGMEWNILARRMDQSLRVLSQSHFPIIELALSDDGLLLASVDLSQSIQLISLPSGRVDHLPTLATRVTRLTFLSGTHRLALGRDDGVVSLYDIDKKAIVAELVPDPPVKRGIAVLLHIPKLRLLAVAYKHGWIYLWDLRSNTLQHAKRVHLGSIQGLTVNRSSDALLSTSMDRSAKLSKLPDLEEQIVVRHSTWVLEAAFSTSGDSFFTGDQQGAIVETQINSGASKEIVPVQSGLRIADMVILPGRREVMYGGVSLQSLSFDRPTMLHNQLGHQSTILSMALAPSRKMIYSGSEDGTIREWSTQPTGMLRMLADERNAIRTVAWMDRERWIAGNSKGKLLRGRQGRPDELRSQTLEGKGILDLVPLSGNEFAVSTADANLSFFTWSGEKPYQMLRLESSLASLQAIGTSVLALTRDGKVMDIQKEQDRWNAAALDLGAKVSTMAGSGVDQNIYWADQAGVLHCTDRQGRETKTLPHVGFKVKKIRPLAGGQRLSIEGEDHTIRILEWDSGKISHTLEGHTRDLDSIQMVPNSRRLVSTGKHEKKLIIWDMEHDEKLLTIDLPYSSLDMALDPSGEKILIGMMWGLVALCDARPLSRKLELTKATRSTPAISTNARQR